MGKVSKRPTLKGLVKKLDSVFSQYIRLRDAHEWHEANPTSPFGYVACCTCGGVRHWKEVDCGHYYGRRSMNTRFEERNAHAQCKGCNCDEGRKAEYTLFLQKKYGPEIIERLVIAGKRPRKFKPFELEGLILHYTAEVKRFENVNRSEKEIADVHDQSGV